MRTRRHTETLWTFKTKRFTIAWEVSPCEDIDLSWDETGEVLEALNSGRFTAFDSAVVVYLDGRELGADYLGQSIYENVCDFRREHLGSRASGHGSYFADMVWEAVRQARLTLANAPRVRAPQ